MKTQHTSIPAAPPLLTGAAILFWGWQNNFIISSLMMALLLEAKHIVNMRFPISDKEFNQVSDLTAVVLFISVIFIFNEDGSKGIFTILSVNPFVMYLLVLLQVYSEQGKIKYSTLFMSMRKIERADPNERIPAIDLSYPYFILCLLAAGAGNQQGPWFFAIICVLISIMLLWFRPKRYHITLWAVMLCLAVSISYAGQLGMLKLQSVFRANMAQLFEQFVWRYRDPNRTSTAIGSIGRFKLSDRIVLRTKTAAPLARRLYLREATFNLYGHGLWSNNSHAFTAVKETGESQVWKLGQHKTTHEATISSYFVRETGVIPLPHATQKISNVPAIKINRTALNTVNMDIYDGWVKYTVDYTRDKIFDPEPENVDLYLPKNYRDLFQGLAQDLQLDGLSEPQIIAVVENWFSAHFSYTLDQTYWYPKQDFLKQFLYQHRKGHCEYFATATVLLLRAAGIPARYAVGYAVDEYSPWEDQYIARARDAHAWVLAYIHGEWQLIDTTPGVWDSLEAENASIMEPVWDAWSWLTYRYSLWKAKDALKDENRSGLLLLLIPLLLYVAWRLHAKKRQSDKASKSPGAELKKYGTDSAFYQIIQFIQSKGFAQNPGETVFAWLNRYQSGDVTPGLQHALALHYQYRFDPLANHGQMKTRLDSVCRDIVEKLHAKEKRQA